MTKLNFPKNLYSSLPVEVYSRPPVCHMILQKPFYCADLMLKKKSLLPVVSIEQLLTGNYDFFGILWLIESSKEQNLLEIYIFCNAKIFTVTFNSQWIRITQLVAKNIYNLTNQNHIDLQKMFE